MQEILAQLLLMLRGAWRYRWPALALAWAVALVGWLAVAVMPDRFEARTRVYVDAESLLKPLLQGIAVDRDVMSQVSMMQSVMKSRPNLEKVARKTDLFLSADSSQDQEQVIDSLQERIVLQATTPLGPVRRAAVPNEFIVSFEDSNPKTAYRVVQALLDTFMEDSLGIKRDDAGVAERFISQQLADYERKLLEAESRLADFKKTNVGLMPGTSGDYYQRLDQSMAQLARWFRTPAPKLPAGKPPNVPAPSFGLRCWLHWARGPGTTTCIAAQADGGAVIQRLVSGRSRCSVPQCKGSRSAGKPVTVASKPPAFAGWRNGSRWPG